MCVGRQFDQICFALDTVNLRVRCFAEEAQSIFCPRVLVALLFSELSALKEKFVGCKWEILPDIDWLVGLKIHVFACSHL